MSTFLLRYDRLSPGSVQVAYFIVQVLLVGDIVQGNGTGFASTPSGIEGEFRMLSDSAIARDARTACKWQSLIGK